MIHTGVTNLGIPLTAAYLSWVLAVPLFWLTRYVDAVAHEGGHALIGKLLFRKIVDIRFVRGGGGATDFGKEKLPWLVDVLVTAAGYLGPSMFGLLAIPLLRHGATEAVLWASVVFLLLMMLAVRGPIGLLLVPALIVLIAWIALKVKPPVQVLLTYMWVWFLLIAPVQEMVVHIDKSIFRDARSDPAFMQRLTRLPSELWALAFLVGTVAALVYGGSLLLHG